MSNISNVKSFRDEIRIKCTLYFHLYCKSRCLWRNLHRWQKFYTAAGSDGMNKSHLCMTTPDYHDRHDHYDHHDHEDNDDRGDHNDHEEVGGCT